MHSYVAQGGGPNHGINDGMQEHIGIRVAQEPAFVVDLNAAKDKRPPLDQPVTS